MLEQLNCTEWNLVGLCETKRKGEGLTELPCGSWIYDVGKTEDRPVAKGLAFLVNKSFKDYIVSFHAHSDRIISCILNLKNETIQIVQVYAPTTDYDDETIEQFYDDLEEAIDRKNNAHVIVMGDFNAKIGKKGKDENNNWIGNHGIGVRNERGERLLDFATENRFFITNTFFEKPASRYWTWDSPGSNYKNQIDFILTTDKMIFQNTEILTRVDIGSDHRMLRGKVKLNKKLARLKKIHRKKAMKIDIQKIEADQSKFQIALNNRFALLNDNTPTIEELNEIISESIQEINGNATRAPTSPEIDPEIVRMEEERKQLREIENKTIEEIIKYTELNKTVKKKRRAKARRKRKEFILGILENKKGPKEIYKHGSKKKISSMKDKDGKKTSNREEILKICEQFYKELYDKTIQDPPIQTTSSADTEKAPPFTEREVESCLKDMSKNKAPGPDQITSDVYKLGGEQIIKCLTECFNNILETKKIPPSWNEAKIIILYKKGDPDDIKNYRPISLLAHSYKLFTRLLQKRMEEVLDRNQPREQAGFRKHFSTTDHIYTLNQVIEKCNEFNLPLCVGYIDYEKAFDSVEHFAIFEALRKINVKEDYVQILENIYDKATARIHIDGMESEPFPIKRGVRQGDPISPKLFTSAIEEIFKKAELSSGIEIDGETLTDLRFADDVALLTKTPQQMESQMNTLNNISKTVGLKMHKGKTKYMLNYPNQDTVCIETEEIEKVEKYKYLGQTTYLRETTKEEIKCRIRAGWSCFGRNREVFLDDEMPMSLRRQVFDQCVLPSMTYGCQTWSLTKEMGQRLRTAQRTMERKMLKLKVKDKVKCADIRKRTGVQDIVQFVLKQKWKWAGHVARLSDNRWTQRVTEWQPREGRRARGRQRRRWRDDLVQQKGAAWRHDAQNRQRWRRDVEGYFQQWRNTAS